MIFIQAAGFGEMRMPFDGADWEVPRPRPQRAPSERAFSLLLLFLGFCLLIMPISGAALVDIVNYLRSSP